MSGVCVVVCAERKLDSFVASQYNRNIEKTASHHRDNVPTVNCFDIDMSPTNDAERRQSPCEVSNSRCITPSCSLLNTSKSKADYDSESTDISFRDEIVFTDRQEKCSADLSRTVDIRRINDCVANTGDSICGRDIVEIDGNCNSIFTGDCKHDLNVNLGASEIDCSHNNNTSPSAFCDYSASDRMSQSNQVSRETSIVAESSHDLPAVITVWRIAV